jgi:hypothetical protein
MRLIVHTRSRTYRLWSSSPINVYITNIARGHHHRQPSTSTNSITSPPSPIVVIVNANKIIYFFN